MEFNGKVIYVSSVPVREGDGKNGHYSINVFAVETQDRYPSRMCFEVKSNILENKWALWNLRLGEVVSVQYSCDASEYKGRWYNNISAYKLSKMQQIGGAPSQQQSQQTASQSHLVGQPVDPAIQGAVDMFNRNGIELQ